LRKGLDLIDLLGKIMLGAMAILFLLSFVVGPILLFVTCGFFFIFPILESTSTFFYKWLYRNIIVGKGFLDEEADTWEKFKWRIIKVVPFEKLPKIKHDLYVKNIEENYRELIRDKKLDKINKKFSITMDGNVKPIRSIQQKLLPKKNVEKGQIEFKDEEEVGDIEVKQIEGDENQNE
jgi:hypothetical protein